MNQMMIKILPVRTSKDIEVAKALFTEYAEFLKKELCEYADLPWLIRYYRNFEKEIDSLPDRYKQPKGQILLARYGELPADCVALGGLSDCICEMKRLFIRPKYRRKGIGTALCEALIEQAKEIGYTHMRLATALEIPKILYNFLGFKKIAPYEDVPSEIKSVVFMELKLGTIFLKNTAYRLKIRFVYPIFQKSGLESPVYRPEIKVNYRDFFTTLEI